jgi:hypothetical protein
MPTIQENLKKSKWYYTESSVLMTDGTWKEMKSWISDAIPGLAIVFNEDHKCRVIVHIPTGKCLGVTFGTLDKAKEAVERFLADCDWTGEIGEAHKRANQLLVDEYKNGARK